MWKTNIDVSISKSEIKFKWKTKMAVMGSTEFKFIFDGSILKCLRQLWTIIIDLTRDSDTFENKHIKMTGTLGS